MKILVTGGAGFIGSNLVDRLLKHKHEVVAIDDLSGGNIDNLPNDPSLYFEQEDCRDSHQIDKIFKEYRPDLVYHLAANAAENKSQFSPIDISSRGYMASINVLTSAIRHSVKKFIFTSSIAVYGKAQLPYRETDRPEPEDLYGIGKLAFEEALKVMSKVHGIDYVILRPHNVYGPKQSMADPFRNVVTIFMNSCLNNFPHILYGKGNMVRCFTYIDDVTDALYKSMDLSKTTINVGSSTPYTVKELSDLIIETSKIKVPQELVPPRPQEIMKAISDHTLSDKIFKIKPTSLEEGIKLTWKWVKNQPPVTPMYSNLEIVNDKLPVNWRK